MAWNRRDLESIGSTLNAEAEWVRSVEFPEGRTLRGSESMVDFARSMFEVFVETPIDLIECAEILPGEVLVAGKSRFRGDLSGAEIEARWVRVYSVRDGAVSRVRPYPSREQALAEVRDRPGP